MACLACVRDIVDSYEVFWRNNDQVHRARGPMGLNVEQPKSVNEGEDAEKPKDERAPGE